jgi:precorrin-6B methylase 2
MQNNSGEQWRSSLALWAIPESILEQAPEDPWIHPPAMFQIPETITDSISHSRAREVLEHGDSVLDIGCGGGIAAFALTPPATHVIGVDHQPEMLSMFQENARARGVTFETFDGFWPQIESSVPKADVAVAHHVVYNVQNIEDFLIAMTSHAKKRVVLELPQMHPLSNAVGLWKHFWNLDRPLEPTPVSLMEVLKELGYDAQLELWDGQMRQESDLEMLAHYSRIRLCLPAEREAEVFEFLKNQPPVAVRHLAAIWWDVR